ncbi:MAG: hypothetical protein ACK4M2_12425 [Brevundimonas sp.]
MAKRQAILAGVLAACALCGTALAQAASPITSGEVAGDWMLKITPAERQDLSISFESKSGNQLDFPLTVTPQPRGRLSCVLDGDPANCRIRDGKLVVVMASGGVRMTFTLTGRSRGGFLGDASLRVRLLPIGGHIGAVTMARRS